MCMYFYTGFLSLIIFDSDNHRQAYPTAYNCNNSPLALLLPNQPCQFMQKCLEEKRNQKVTESRLSRPSYDDHETICQNSKHHKFERFNSTPDVPLFGLVLILGTIAGYMSTYNNEYNETLSCASHTCLFCMQNITMSMQCFKPYMEMFCVQRGITLNYIFIYITSQ